jgi:hypothetical protein
MVYYIGTNFGFETAVLFSGVHKICCYSTFVKSISGQGLQNVLSVCMETGGIILFMLGVCVTLLILYCHIFIFYYFTRSPCYSVGVAQSVK